MIVLWVIVALITWCAIGTEILIRIDRHEDRIGSDPLDPESRSDRGWFRTFSFLWPLALILYAIFAYETYLERHPGRGRIKEWFKGGGLTSRYMNWRQRH